MTSQEKTQLICKILSEKKAQDIVYIDVSTKSSLCDCFVICSGRSTTQVKSISENLEEKLSKEYGLEPGRREGVRAGTWAVLDYNDVIVHVFNGEERDFYCLERLWDDGSNSTKYTD
jgi:ribosome-associated protein